MSPHLALAAGTLWLLNWVNIQAQGVDHPSAVEALAGLPIEAIEHLTAIVGLDGRPTPERWRFIVWDPTAENGFYEYVVLDGRLSSRNTASQFAESVLPRDQLSVESLKIDSINAAWIALQYAKANGSNVGCLDYQLRSSHGETPFWKVDCYDSRGQPIGSITVAADEGTVLGRSGLPKEPNLPLAPKLKPTPAWRHPVTPDRTEIRRMARREQIENSPEEDFDPQENAVPLEEQEYRPRDRVSRRPPVFPLERILRSILPF
jgi:hypothetical protein